MPRSRVRPVFSVAIVCLVLAAGPLPAQSAPENKRCLTREQLNIEPIFSACPPLVDQASVSDNSFIARLRVYNGPSRYTMRWRGQGFFNEDVFTYNAATGLYDGFCATRACSIGHGGWVQMEHWDYFVGTLLADNVGTWTYEELHDDVVAQSRSFEVRELELSALSGANQTGIVDQNMPRPLVLKLESFEGVGIEDEVIGWSIDGPKGAKRAAVYGIGSGSETDAEGIDSATIRLGSKPGVYSVTLNNRRITEASQPTFTFTAIDDIEDTNPEPDHPDFEEGVGENRGQQCDSVGNPVTLSVGNKFQREVDFESNGISPMEFVRYHNSLGFVSTSFANYWTHTYDRQVEIPGDPRTDPVKVARPDGKKINFHWNGNAFQANPGIHSLLEETSAGWRYVDEDSTVENFDANGQLLDITDRFGRLQIARHDSSGRLVRIESNIGGSLDFGYDRSGRLASVTDQAGRSWAFRYEILGRLSHVDNPDGTTREYHYEDLRHAYALTGITRENGQRYSYYEYDESGRATASYHAGDADRVDIHYAANGDRVVLDPLGNATVYQTRIENKRGVLDGISGPICSQGCGQTDVQYSYDAQLNVTSKTSYGITTRYGDYDAKGQPGYMIEAAGLPEERRTEFQYDARFLNRITRITEPSVYPGASRITSRNYDVHGNLASETVAGFDPSGGSVSRTITHVFDGPLGQLSATDGPRTDVDDVTTYEYYPNQPAEGPNRARLRAVVDPSGIRTREEIVYSATGKILSEARPNGVTINYEYYDGNDRIKSVTESGGGAFNRTRWEYFPTGDVQRVIVDDESGDEIISQFVYDPAGRLRRIESRVGSAPAFLADQWVSYEFDAAGNVVTETRESRDTPLNNIVIERVFDAYDRLDITTQGGVSADFDYNPDGTLAAKADGNLNTTTYDYDAFRRLTRTNHVGRVTLFEYDTHGNAITVTDPENHSTGYLYDDLGNQVRQDSPDTGTTAFGHNESGQVISRTDAAGQDSLLTYDAAGRLTGIDRAGPEYDVSYDFDDCGNGQNRLCAMSTGWGHRIEYGWNAIGELTSVTSNEGRIGYTHGPQNTLTSIEYPSGREVIFELDGGGLPLQVRLRNGGMEAILVDDIEYSALNRPVAWRFANGLRTQVSLDTRHRPLTIDVGGFWTWQASAYDAGDNLLAVSNGSETYVYGYDVMDRLTEAESGSWNVTYSYDEVGNRLSRVVDGIVETGIYQAGSNRLMAYADRQYQLDPNGNTIAVSVSQEPYRSLAYSSHDRLVEITDRTSESSLASYRYDALGQRVEKVTAAGTRKFVYGLSGELLAVLDGNGKVLHEYVYLDGLPIIDLNEVPDQLPAAIAGEIVIDNDAANVVGANWQTKPSSAAVNGRYLQNRKRDNRAVYWYVDRPGFAGGSHDVYVKWLEPAGEGTSTVFKVRGAGTSVHRVTVAHAGNGAGDWVLLGNFEFAPAGNSPSQYVVLSGADNRYGLEGTFLEADAVKIVPTTLPEGESQLRFIHGDHLGTPRLVTDESGQVVWTASYLPFGEATVDEDPDRDGAPYVLNLRFPGQYFDPETGMHYNYLRNYDPGTGRYLTSDPAGLEAGLNTYLYAGANPLLFVDPLGLAVEGSWIMSPKFNLLGVAIDDWQTVSPSFSRWGYLQFIRLHGSAWGYVNIDVKCTDNCVEWEIHDRVTVSAQGSFDIGPNLYALGVGLAIQNPIAGIGANLALGGSALLQAEHRFLSLAQEKAGSIISAALASGPTLICLGSRIDDN